MKYNCLYKFWYDLKLSDRIWCKILLHMIRCITPHERQNIFFVSSCDLARVYQHFVIYWFKSSITKTISRVNGKHFLHNLTNLLLSFKENTWQCNLLIIFFSNCKEIPVSLCEDPHWEDSHLDGALCSFVLHLYCPLPRSFLWRPLRNL